MAYTTLNVANLALSHIGAGDSISSLTTDVSATVDAVNAFLEATREQTLRDFPWPFATYTADSTVTSPGGFVAVASSPNNEWGWSYRYPTDCVEIRRLWSGLRMDQPGSRVPYRIGFDGTTGTATGRLIFTDMEDAVMEYTAYVTDMSIYTVDFVMAWSYRLAWHIAPRLAMNYSPETTKNLMQMYAIQIARAQANAANEEQPDRPSEAEWTNNR